MYDGFYMPERFTFFFFILTFVLFFVVNILTRVFSLYWVYPWFDTPMHILGGAVIALGFHSMPSIVARVPRKNRTLLITLACVLSAGVFWEMFEYTVGYQREVAYIFDTVVDLTGDIIGALMGFYFVRTLEKLHRS
jgi:hypothetical protein